MIVADLQTPALVVDATAFEYNIATMAAERPGGSLRPHVKAHKSTALAQQQFAAGHQKFCAATPKEIIGMANAGLGADLLLANETLDTSRLQAMAVLEPAVTIAVDSDETIDAAASAGIRRALIDANVGLPRCGCRPNDAGRLADRARSLGIEVRGVMGYEGHAVGVVDRADRTATCEASMDRLAIAHELVGGDIVSAGGTGTFDISGVPNEIQAGSYALMDTAYSQLDVPFKQALWVIATVISARSHYAVCDCGLKALGMDHGLPMIAEYEVQLCSDEHITFSPRADIGAKIMIAPAHVDPTAAYHDVFHVADGPGLDARVIDAWPINLRGW